MPAHMYNKVQYNVYRGRILGCNWDKSLYSLFLITHLCLLICTLQYNIMSTEAEFLDVIGTKVFLLAIHSHLYKWILLSPLKLVCYVNIVYGNLKSENSQDYAHKPQRNCTFMNSASGTVLNSPALPFLELLAELCM